MTNKNRQFPKISIITVTYNSEETIEDTIKSVKSQSYEQIEHIIIDGVSSDNTLKIVNNYSESISLVVSEPDDGIYDAFNKGLKKATGDIIAILNSDDVLFDKEVLALVIKTFNQTGSDIVYGDAVMVKKDNLESIVRFWRSSNFIPGSFKDGWHPPHPSFFVKKSIYENFGYFDTSIDVSADFELMLRFMERYKVNSSYLRRTLSRMRVGGHSQNIMNIVKGAKSINKSFKKNKIKINIPYYFLIRYTSKIREIIAGKLYSKKMFK